MIDILEALYALFFLSCLYYSFGLYLVRVRYAPCDLSAWAWPLAWFVERAIKRAERGY